MKDRATLIVGDLHCKQAEILPLVDGLTRESAITNLVFLGDYVDEWGTTAEDVLTALRYQLNWAKAQEDAGRTATFLVGNHDFEYLTGGACSGTHFEAAKEIRELLLQIPLVAAVALDGFLVTHAGITESWRRIHASGHDDASLLATVINELFRSDSVDDQQALDECGPSRGGWGVPGPLWADKRDLMTDAAQGVKQIVGHTPVETCAPLERSKDPIWFCDTLSLTRAKSPIGDGTALLISDGQPTAVELRSRLS